jgi:ketosteroid isomerase-like protein
MIIVHAVLLAVAPASPLAAQSSPALLEVPANDAQDNLRSSPREVLTAYRTAIQKLDSTEMSALFSEESQVFENGKSEGSFTHYFEHHLGPELDHIKSFTFTNPKITVAEYGDMAIAHESYGYVIVLKDGRIIERTGVATSVLKPDGENWKILRYHSSSRAPKKK